MGAMSQFRKIATLFLFLILLSPTVAQAIESAPPLSDREVIERLTRLEAGQGHMVDKIDANTEAIVQLRTDMQIQFQQLRQDMNARFEQMDSRFAELTQFMLGIVGAFAALVAITIGFALWDRRTTLRPLEDRVKAVEAEQARDRERLDSLLEFFRSLGRGDERVAEMLRQSRLL